MARKMNRHGLRPLQLMFVSYIMQGHAPTVAVQKTPGLTENYQSAAVLAGKYMKDPKVVAELHDQMRERAARLGLTGDRLVLELMNIAFTNPQELYNKDGSLKPITELEPHVAALVQSVEEEEIWEGRGEDREQVGRLKKIKLYSRTDALKELCKLTGLTPDTLKVVVEGTVKHQHAHIHADMPAEEVARLYLEQVRGNGEVIDG